MLIESGSEDLNLFLLGRSEVGGSEFDRNGNDEVLHGSGEVEVLELLLLLEEATLNSDSGSSLRGTRDE